MNTFNLRIYVPDNIFFEGECEHITLSTDDGLYGILSGNRNIIAEVVPGILSFRSKDEEKKSVVTRAMVKIEDNGVLVLVYRCEDTKMIDINDLKRAKAEAQRQLREKRSREEFHNAEANLSRAFSNLNMKNKEFKY